MANINERGERFSHLLASTLKGAIGEYGQTIRAVSKAIGVHHTTMSGYFSGSRILPANTFSDACEVIGVDPAELVARAYTRLIREMGPYQADDATIIDLYTPSHGIPLVGHDPERHAALHTSDGPSEEAEGSMDTP